jgi:tryptophanyl-tRNA synthetase
MTTAPAAKKTVALTGVKPTGAPHIANYIGAMRGAIQLCEQHDSTFIFIADYHALNAVHDAAALRRDTYEVAACFLALGLEPAKTAFYRQSDVPQIFELTQLLAAVTPKGLMDRGHAYKSSVDKNREAGRDVDADVNMGLYTYPILMAADIVSMQATVVPVGQDQVQHIEFARDMAGYFNNTFKKPVFTLPQVQLEKNGALLPGIDGRKMSKSYNNHIPVFMESNARRKLVMKIVTDSKRPEEPKEPEGNTIFQLYSQFATTIETETMRQAFVNGGMGYGDAKQALFEVLERSFAEPGRIYADLMADTSKIDRLLAEGAEKAKAVAAVTLAEARRAAGIGA